MDPSTCSTVSGLALVLLALIFDGLSLSSPWVIGSGAQVEIDLKAFQLCPPEETQCIAWPDIPAHDKCCSMQTTMQVVGSIVILAFLTSFGTMFYGCVLVYRSQHWRGASMLTGIGCLVAIFFKFIAGVYLVASSAYDPNAWQQEGWSYLALSPIKELDRRLGLAGYFLIISCLIHAGGSICFLCYTQFDMCHDVDLVGVSAGAKEAAKSPSSFAKIRPQGERPDDAVLCGFATDSD